jgi:hypothetical protein
LLGTVAKLVAMAGVASFCWSERLRFLMSDHSACPDDVGLVVFVKPHGQ